MRAFALLMLTASVAAAQEAPRKAFDANHFACLDGVDPYYPSHLFPKLITSQWVGDKDVECVVILGIDDMRDPKRYEAYLRPILRRLQEIDGRAPLSIMTCSVDPMDPQLQTWLKEGVSLECHTVDHPCPFFKNGFAKAKDTYDRCVDLLNQVPNNRPVAFRMPCCDSMNTPSPRHWAEIFNKTTEKGNYLSIDTSVFNVFTSADPELPRDLVLNDKGEERFKRYLPADRSFVNTIENYPYPYVIGRLCWEFPCMTPSDWEAQHLQKPNNPDTVRDMKAALDCAVVKKGVFCLVFHPHGWIRNDQVVELIDHAVKKHGKKVKFLNFREAQERLTKNLLDDQPLRHAKNGQDNGIRLVDLNQDGYMDAILSNGKTARSRIWLAKDKAWQVGKAPDRLSEVVSELGGDTGVLMVDVDGDGKTEILGQEGRVFKWNEKWIKMPFTMPHGAKFTDGFNHDSGLRLIDLNHDGKLDVVFSNEKEYGIHLFTDMKKGWSKKVLAGKRGAKPPVADAPGSPLPMISRNGANNGFWVHSGYLWWSNEDTVLLKDHVDRRNIKQLLDSAN